MKITYLSLVIAIFTSSCSSYHAAIKKQENLGYDAVRVYPEWKYKKPKGKKWITPVIGLSSGAAYGYYNETSYGNETYSGIENAAVWGLGGLFVGGIVNGILFPKRNYRKTKFNISQSEEWVESYNKVTGVNYVIQKKEQNNTLVIVPGHKLEQLRIRYYALIRDLESTTPTTDYKTLQDWKYKLNREYSILPSSEIDKISAAINLHGQKVASNELLTKASELDRLDNNYVSLEPLVSFKSDNHSIYSAADKATQQKVDAIVEWKVNEVLDNIIPGEIRTINELDENIYAVNAFYENFHKRYSKFSNYGQVKRGYAALASKKTSIVRSQSNKISAEIKNSSTVPQLTNVEDKYLTNTDKSNSQIIILTNQINSRKNEILESERKREIAEAQRLKQQEEYRKTQELEAFKRLMNETTASGEPTEWQMKFAVNYQIQARIGQMEDLNNLEIDPNNPGTTILKLLASTTAGTQAKITSFEKYGCMKANGKPGYTCDYVATVKLSGNNPWYTTLNQLGTAEIKTARFAKVKGFWMLVEYMD